MSDLKIFKASENPSIHEGKRKHARHAVVTCQNCESSAWSCNKKLPQLPLVVRHRFYWLLLYIVGTRLPNLQDDYWLRTKTWHSVRCTILIPRFPYDVRTEFTDFEFSTENNVIKFWTTSWGQSVYIYVTHLWRCSKILVLYIYNSYSYFQVPNNYGRLEVILAKYFNKDTRAQNSLILLLNFLGSRKGTSHIHGTRDSKCTC